MLKKLKRKFLFITYLSILFVVLIIVGIINISNYSSTLEKHDNVISHVLDNRLEDENSTIVLKYILIVDIPSCTITQGFLNESYVLEDLITSIVSQNKDRGRYQDFMYAIDSNKLILSNIEREIQVTEDFFINSIIISLLGILGVYIIIYLCSSYILKPFIKNEENQKEFITNVSHELKTPITIIKANLDVLKIEEIENDWTLSIQSQVERLELLTSNLIELSKIEELNTNIIKTEFSLTDAIYEVYNDYKNAFDEKKIELLITSSINVTFNGNEKQIRDTIKLLLDNILKYCSNNNAFISLDNKELTFSNQTNLEPGNYDHIFNRFVRIDESRNQNISGYGIGLSIVKKILDNHQCSVTAYVNNKIFTIKIKL
ncbi:MAG: HAMP domain-containing sensor histidine kinase [bacterium]